MDEGLTVGDDVWMKVPVGEASLTTVGEHSVDDGFSDAVEHSTVLRAVYQRLIVLLCNCREKRIL